MDSGAKPPRKMLLSPHQRETDWSRIGGMNCAKLSNFDCFCSHRWILHNTINVHGELYVRNAKSVSRPIISLSTRMSGDLTMWQCSQKLTGLICRTYQHNHRQWLTNTEWSNSRRWAWAGSYAGPDWLDFTLRVPSSDNDGVH